MKLKLAAAAVATTLAFGAQAADPTAVLTGSDVFTEYTGAGPIGNNNVNVNNVLYWHYESTGTWMGKAVNSWFVLFDPSSDRVIGTVTFDNKIEFVHDDKAELIATASFGKPGVTYDYSHSLVGLERNDKSGTSVVGNTMTLNWRASTPGDHIRVMTAVPEPSTYALMAGGLFAFCFIARRRPSA